MGLGAARSCAGYSTLCACGNRAATSLNFPAPKAGWQSGYAADCNSVNAGSIPTSASILLLMCASAAQRRPRFNDAHAARKYCDMLQSVIIDAR